MTKFDNKTGSWRLTDGNGEEHEANIIISATGPLNRSIIPNFEGKSDLTIPFAQNLLRNYIYYLLEVNVHGFLGNRLFQKRAMKRAEDHRKNQIKDGELLKKATPEYMVGCKRVLVSSDYYPALQMDNVHLITKGLSHFDKKRSNGRRRKSI